MKAIEFQDLAMCRGLRGSAVCAALLGAERDAGRLAHALGELVAVGALPASAEELARHLADAIEAAAIAAGV